MRYAHILSRVTGTPWFITPDALQAIGDLLSARLQGARLDLSSAPDDPEDDDASSASQGYAVRSAGGIAIIEACGLFGKHLSSLETMCGGCDYDEVVSAVRAAAADPMISKIILCVSSRGGTAIGAPEAFAALRAIRAESGKPLLGFSDTQADSAGYYLLAACDAIFCTTTANLGCIGAILQLVDASEADAKAGIKRFAIKSASMKDVGTSARPPTPAELSFFQSQIDFLGGLFKRDMQAARPSLAPELLETGLYYYGPEAVAKGLADGLVGSLDELVASLSAAPVPSASI